MPNPTQRLLTLLTIDPGQVAWDATLTTNYNRIMDFFRSFLWSLPVAGSTASPSTVRLKVQSLAGADKAEQFPIRIRLCDDSLFSISPDGALVVAVGTLVESVTAGKDIIVLPDNTGKIDLTYTNAVAGDRYFRVGPAPAGSYAADWSPAFKVTHA